jgi:outer membrane protein OmpA-like peptidoglycan-associated protein
MKKIAMFFAAAAIAVSASAQRTAVTANKAGDNFYVGIHAGAVTTLTNKNFSTGKESAFSAYAAQAGVRVGKNFTTVFGLALDGNVYFKNHSHNCPFKMGMTFIQAFDVDLLGTANLMNLFAGYKGQPRTFEVIALGGFGWTHVTALKKANGINSKVGFDFALNFGGKKQWQVYLEPSLVYQLQGFGSDYSNEFVNIMSGDGFKFNSDKALFSLNAGVNYKFGTSNGKHNFAVEQLRDQAEIDALNAKLNAAQADANAAKANSSSLDGKIAELQKALNDCMNKPAAAVVKQEKANLQPSVIFKQGKSVVERSQEANLELIAKYMKNNKDAKIKISGYASPEGSKELNQKLSEKRAEACKTILVKKYKIDANRLQTEGLGATDKLFDEVEFNRVALFNDVTK